MHKYGSAMVPSRGCHLLCTHAADAWGIDIRGDQLGDDRDDCSSSHPTLALSSSKPPVQLYWFVEHIFRGQVPDAIAAKVKGLTRPQGSDFSTNTRTGWRRTGWWRTGWQQQPQEQQDGGPSARVYYYISIARLAGISLSPQVGLRHYCKADQHHAGNAGDRGPGRTNPQALAVTNISARSVTMHALAGHKSCTGTHRLSTCVRQTARMHTIASDHLA